jgi:hypothetical protein
MNSCNSSGAASERLDNRLRATENFIAGHEAWAKERSESLDNLAEKVETIDGKVQDARGRLVVIDDKLDRILRKLN